MPEIKLSPATPDLAGSGTLSPSISSLGIPGMVEAVPKADGGILQGAWPEETWSQTLTQGGAWPGKGRVDLSVLWQMLEQHKEEQRKQTEQVKVTTENQMDATWEMVVIQGVLLTILVLMSVCWAFCCKKKCFCLRAPLVDEVVAMARKISSGSSKDLPPSYSKLDLSSLEMSVNDYLYPPPTYLEICQDSLQYLDLEMGTRRSSRVSLGGSDLEAAARLGRDSVATRELAGTRRISLVDGDGVGRRVSLVEGRVSLVEGIVSGGTRLSVSSCSSCHSETPVFVTVGSGRASTASSRRSSRVSFCEDVSVSNGSIRRLSKNSLIMSSKSNSGMSSKSNSTTSSRSTSTASSRRSSCSETSSRRLSSDGGSRKHSFLEVRRASRKVSPPFPSRKVSPLQMDTLDEELRIRLAKVEEDVDAIRVLPEVIEEEGK